MDTCIAPLRQELIPLNLNSIFSPCVSQTLEATPLRFTPQHIYEIRRKEGARESLVVSSQLQRQSSPIIINSYYLPSQRKMRWGTCCPGIGSAVAPLLWGLQFPAVTAHVHLPLPTICSTNRPIETPILPLQISTKPRARAPQPQAVRGAWVPAASTGGKSTDTFPITSPPSTRLS